jgi:hypothetical protein
MVPIAESDPRIHPVHESVLQVENCFKFDELFYQCESPQERTRWLQRSVISVLN